MKRAVQRFCVGKKRIKEIFGTYQCTVISHQAFLCLVHLFSYFQVNKFSSFFLSWDDCDIQGVSVSDLIELYFCIFYEF